jgi:hypothetical protein
MFTLFDATRPVKSTRPFGEGILPDVGYCDGRNPSVACVCPGCLDAAALFDSGDFEPTAEDLRELANWSSELTARDHLDASERLTLAELADHQADFYRGWGNPCGEMFARAMVELALKIRMTDATTPADFEARVEILDRDVRDQWEAIGYQEGLEAGRREARPAGFTFGHMA